MFFISILKQRRKTKTKTLKAFFAQFIAFVISSLSQTIGSPVDGNIIGQFLGTDSIAAFGIVNPLLTTFSVVGVIVVKVYSHRLCIRDRSLMDKITLMPANFGVPEEDEMENNIDTMDEVVGLSQEVWNF